MIECVSMKEEHTSASRLLKEFAAHGSQAAFGELVRSHADLVYSVCWRVLGERAAAEDAAQATFLVLFQKAPTLAPDTVLASWLYRVAELSAKKIRCAQQRRARHERQAMVREQTTERFTEEWEDVRPHLDAALAALPAAQRDVLILRYIQGFTRAELAQTLTCAEETVHKRLSRGLENLRGRLRRAGVFVPLVALTAFLSERAVEAAPQELAAGITRACLVKAASPVASAVAKHVAAKLFWTPFKTILLAAMVAAAVVLPATHMALRQDPTAGNSPPESTRPAAESSIDLEAAKPKETEDDGLHLDDATRWHVTGDLPVTIERERVLFNADEALGKVFQEPGRVYRRNMQSLMHWEMGEDEVAMALTLSVDLPASAPAQIYVNAVFGSRNDRIQNGEHNKFICLKLEGTTRRAFTFPDASAQEVRKVRPWGRIYRDPRTHYRLELFVSRHKVLSRVNGQVLYHGPHNQEIDEVFPSLLLCGDENLLRSSGVTVRIENISVRRCPMPQSEGMSTEEF